MNSTGWFSTFIKTVITEKGKVFIRSNLVCLLFVTCVVFSIQDKTASSLISKEPKENVPFNSSNETIKYQVNISMLALENVYNVDRDYAFFIPEVSVVCECACTTRNEMTCSDKTDSDDRRCAYLINSTTSCTVHHSFGTDTSVCPNYYRMCCQVFFSKNDFIKGFRAVHIKHNTSILKLQMELKSSDGKIKIIDVQVLQGIEYFHLISHDYVHSVPLTPTVLLPNDWYFIEDGSNELYFSEKMNEFDEYNLDKIGWFQSRKNQLSRVPIMDLKQRLRVKPSNCHRPTYEWKLNAIGYYSEEGSSRFPKERRKVIEMYKNSIKKISLNINEGIINVEAKRSPTIHTPVNSTTYFLFIFTSNISLRFEQEPVLSLSFTKGDGDTRIEITNPQWRNIVSFSINVASASADHPVQRSFDLPSTPVEVFLVCATQSKQQICQSPIIIKEKIIFANATEIPVSHFSTEISGNNATNDDDDTKDTTTIWIVIAVVLLVVVLTPPVIIFVYRRIKQKRSKQNNSGNRNQRDNFENEECFAEIAMPLKGSYRPRPEADHPDLYKRQDRHKVGFHLTPGPISKMGEPARAVTASFL